MTSYPWKRVWIVGGSSGLGAEAAKLLASHHVNVYVSARNEKALKELCDGCDYLNSLPLDVTDLAACEKAVETFLGSLPDLILLNAAIYSPIGMDNFNALEIKNIMDVNYMGAVNMFSALLPYRNSGRQITIASVASPSGWRGLPRGVGYGPTKAALINLVEGLKPELDKTNFDLRLVNPGFIKTRLTDKNEFGMPQLMNADYAARVMLKGIARGKFDTSFPNPFIFFFRILRLIPNWLYFKYTRTLVK